MKSLIGIALLVIGILIAGFAVYAFLTNPQSFSLTATSNAVLLVVAIILIFLGAYFFKSDDF